ncbi:MAG: phosphoenolpyruvate--protein phosphotransferase [Candidatus Methanomethylicaceae archaeon]
MSIKLNGIGITDKIVIGRVHIYLKDENIEILEKDYISSEDKIKQLFNIIEKVKEELNNIYEKIKETNPKEAEIFTFHKAILEDDLFINKIKFYLENNYSLAYAIKKVTEEMIKEFESIPNEFFKERAKDIRDVGERLLKKALGIESHKYISISSPKIIAAKDLTPSDTANLDKKNTLGFITELGGKSSHTAILAQALGIPAIVGIKDLFKYIKAEDEVILDAYNGIVIINPSPEEKEYYIKIIEEKLINEREIEKFKNVKIILPNGKHLKIFANIGDLNEAEIALNSGAEGIGLFRTEFLFLNKPNPPSEEEQFLVYKKVAELFRDKTVIVRTLDIGGDKDIPYLNLKKENNPFLGIRGIRLCLREKELFKTQLKAILRANNFGNIKIMYPMVSIREEIEAANKILNEAKEELIKEKVNTNTDIDVGIMVEVPSIALALEEVVDLIGFVSIGSNDLIQYIFAADRTCDEVNYLYRPNHPSIINLIKRVIDICHKNNIEVGICGEIGGDPKTIPTLIDLGIDELSMVPNKIPSIKKFILNLK